MIFYENSLDMSIFFVKVMYFNERNVETFPITDLLYFFIETLVCWTLRLKRKKILSDSYFA